MLQRRITRFRAKPNSESGYSCAASRYAHALPTFLSSSNRNNNKSRNSKSSNNNSTSRRLRHRPRSPPPRAPRLWPVSPPARRFCWPSLPTHLGGRCRHRLPASPRAPTRLRVEQRWCVILRHHKPSSSYTSRFSGTLRLPSRGPFRRAIHDDKRVHSCPSPVSMGFSLFCNFNFSFSSTSLLLRFLPPIAADGGGLRRILARKMRSHQPVRTHS